MIKTGQKHLDKTSLRIIELKHCFKDCDKLTTKLDCNRPRLDSSTRTSSAMMGMKMVVVAMLLVNEVMMVAMKHISITMTHGSRSRNVPRYVPITPDKPDTCPVGMAKCTY